MNIIPFAAVPFIFASLSCGQDCSWSYLGEADPGKRVVHSMAFDQARSEAVLFGGWLGLDLVGDTWTWNGAQWTFRASNGPAPRDNSAMAYDTGRAVTTLFGGGAGDTFGDTWEWDGDDWTLRATSGPAPRWGHAMAHDSVRARTILFGGNICADNCTYFGDTWEWDGATWTEHKVPGPAPRAFFALAFDESRAVTVLHGGFDSNQQPHQFHDIWEWDGQSWTQVSDSGPPRDSHAMVYDPVRKIILLHGGWAPGFDIPGDTWLWDGQSWTKGPDGPRLAAHGLVYDTARREVFQYAGLDWDVAVADSWTLACACYPDLNTDSALDLFDFLAFINLFNQSDPAADCDASGSHDLFDFLCFVNAFNEGC
jgi:hypothetical protein